VADAKDLFGDPQPLAVDHDLDAFESGEPVLDEWLRERAFENARIGASKTYVICISAERRVVGFHALSMGQILNREATGAMRRGMPRTIPAVVLARLAVDRAWQGRGLGATLLRDAVTRAMRAAEEVSARLVVVHAISPAAEAFYRHHGFTRLPVETPTFALDLAAFRKVLARR
jgi:GNAT superfamily N-acetyltransferase